MPSPARAWRDHPTPGRGPSKRAHVHAFEPSAGLFFMELARVSRIVLLRKASSANTLCTQGPASAGPFLLERSPAP